MSVVKYSSTNQRDRICLVIVAGQQVTAPSIAQQRDVAERIEPAWVRRNNDHIWPSTFRGGDTCLVRDLMVEG